MNTGRTEGSEAALIRVCIVGPSMDVIGGQSVVVEQLRNHFSQDPEIQVIFVPVNPRLPLLLRPLKNVKYLRTLVSFTMYVVSFLFRVPRSDVVHVFSASYWSFILAPVPAILLGRLFRKPVILNYHSGEADDHLSNWRTAVPLCRMASAIVVPSEYLVHIFDSHGLRATAVPNFVEIEALPYRKRQSLRPVFLSNRSLERHYNVTCALKAFRRIQGEFAGARIIVAGDGSLREQLEEDARKLGVSNVTFVGSVSREEMGLLYDEVDILLNTPDIDNMPMTIIEAFACGLPVVSTDAGGIPYIAENNVTALLVECDDDRAVASAAIRLLRDPRLTAQLTEGARKVVLERYTWAAVRDRWADTYRLMTAGRS